MSLTSDEVNFMVYKYLLESGFTHSAFTFANESFVNRTRIAPGNEDQDIPAGALVAFVQKGLQYLELEANLNAENDNDDDDGVDANFSVLTARDLLSKPVDALKALVKSRREMSAEERKRAIDEEENALKQKLEQRRKAAMEVKKIDGVLHGGDHEMGGFENGVDGVNQLFDVSGDEVTTLDGHLSEVFVCAWNPKRDLMLASGSGDSTARVWTLPAGPSGRVAQAKMKPPSVLEHSSSVDVSATAIKTENNGNNNNNNDDVKLENGEDKLKNNGAGDAMDVDGSSEKKNGTTTTTTTGNQKTKSKDVTTLDWNSEGTMLATGSYDGKARVWDESGKLISTLEKHEGPIFSLKWNKAGDSLLSGSVDKTAIVWDAKSGEAKQTFAFHTAPTLDVDWKAATNIFASSSMDHLIYVCEVGMQKPLKKFKGHKDEVNCIKWDPTGNLLASCSDDYTAKIWSMNQDEALFTLSEHKKEIYTIKWSPTGPGTKNPDIPLMLATASYDHTVKLWDAKTGQCIRTLKMHTEPVYSVAFSPDGKHVASGSFDKRIRVWEIATGLLEKTYRGEGGVFEVCFSADGSKIAACFSNNTIAVLDF
jgi:transducin (beta)-like 1